MKLIALIFSLFLCSVSFGQLNCSNWLSTPAINSSVSVGDLDISGNQVTIEATINRTQPYLPGGGNNTEGDVVSKHNDFSDVNYLLRPNHAYITTTNGFFGTPDVCDIELNKTYHVALVYDGSTLKFYRNGFLMSQVAATGNLIQNNWQTRIGWYEPQGFTTQFIGFVNEVRIWNIARTQAQIKSFMNATLPSPSTQTGLLAYYQFDNLINKQGNTTFNGSLNGTASINATNTNCDFIADTCKISSTCNNWLYTPSKPSYFDVGEIDITGDKVTVEAVFNRTTPYSGGLLYAGDLVSKHNTPSDVNYLLRPNDAEITTSDGYFRTPDICEIELNKTYHVAMVYNGSTLKFYRDGFLMSQVPATGNLFQNAWKTRIGYYEPGLFNTNFIGYINEVRIWNVERTQAQIKNYMNSSLPNPSTQAGLVAYYTFDNLINKQGNTTYNGTLGGGASINAVNPNCDLVVDTCLSIPVMPGSTIINEYTPVISLDGCTNKLTVADASKYNAGDTVLIIQMKGAVIDSSNTASFGTITDYKNAGNYEFNYVKSKSGNVVELKNILTRQYDLPDGKVQLIRVPYFDSYVANDTLTCLPWDGKKGGVLVLNVKNTLELNTDVNVSGRGFKGGKDPFSNPPVHNCYENNFFYPNDPDMASEKGEAIATVSLSRSFGKGALGNGGGGGNSHNSGGGGGANGGAGGAGGYQFEGYPCDGTVPYDNRGIGGNTLLYSNLSNKIFMGGGGGAGHSNNPQGFEATGGNGAGIIIINANELKSNGKKIILTGNDGTACSNTGSGCHEGMGGGGAGGCVLLNINNYLDNTFIDVTGGKGADMLAEGYSRVGPGGGGGSGIIWLKQGASPINFTSVANGGTNGICPGYSNTNWGANPGQSASNLFNLILPGSALPFKPNIDSVRAKSASTSCNTVFFNGFIYPTSINVIKWDWIFDDNTTASAQNTIHVFSATGNHQVKLIVTSQDGCKDSVTINITTSDIIAPPVFTVTQPSCIISSGSLNVSMPLGLGIQYSIDGINFQSSPQFTGLTVNSYSLIVKDLNTQCASLPVNFNITSPLIPATASYSIAQPTCTNPLGKITVTSPTGTSLQYSIDGINFQTNSAFDNTAPGSYNLTVKDTTNKCVSNAVTVVVNAPPANPATPILVVNQPICANDKGNISISSPLGAGLQYSIDNVNYQTNAGFTNLLPGNYNVTVKNSSNNCISAASLAVVNAGTGTPSAPTVIITTQPNCLIPTGSVNVTSPLGSNYAYSLNGSAYQSNTFFNSLATGTYSFTVKNISNGCISNSVSGIINAVPNPPIAPTIDIKQPNCDITTGTITVQSPLGINLQFSINGSSYQFLTSFSNVSAGTYKITAKDTSTQCISSQTTVIVNPVPAPPNTPTLTDVTQPTCKSATGSARVNTPTGSNFEYRIDGGAFDPSNILKNLQQGAHQIIVRDLNTRCVSLAATLVINPPPPLPPTPAASIVAQPTCVLATGAIRISYPLGSNYEYSLDRLTYQSSTMFNNLGPGTYSISVKDPTVECTSLPFEVTLPVNTSQAGIYKVPSAFSPNFDGINDCFGIKYWGVITDFQMTIFNRFGQAVFSTTNPGECWNGMYKGVKALAGNYVYVIKANTYCGLVEKKGNVLLLR